MSLLIVSHVVGLDVIQLHGSEGWTVCSQFTLPVIRAVHVPAPDSLAQSTSGGVVSVTAAADSTVLANKILATIPHGTSRDSSISLAACLL